MPHPETMAGMGRDWGLEREQCLQGITQNTLVFLSAAKILLEIFLETLQITDRHFSDYIPGFFFFLFHSKLKK